MFIFVDCERIESDLMVVVVGGLLSMLSLPWGLLVYPSLWELPVASSWRLLSVSSHSVGP